MSDCKCKSCIEMTHFFKIVEQLPNLDRAWMERFYEDVDNARLDAQVDAAIIDGTWPTADQIIEFRRQNLQDNNKNKDENVNDEEQSTRSI